MIEAENLRTASLYINNQLLSRGLLRDGNTIDFAQPGSSDGEVADTMSRIISVVNDLILRRDRDAEHRESLSATLRTVRAESLRQTNDIQRLQDKYAEAQRKVGLSEAAEAAFRTQLKTAEATVHRLKEEAARTKTLVAQTRASCANEVRKRDRQIESLKKAVSEAGRARGVGKSTGVTTITVVGDVGSEADHTLSPSRTGGAADQTYDLRTETNAFLAELAKGLSDENESLLQLVRRTTEQLKEMSGWDVANGALTEGSGDGHVLALVASPADLALEVDAVLDHLRTILTNPSFVPIEEVVVREDEIHRLRDGWEKMETRWKEAVHLIDGWRRRMQASGRPVNVEELKMGLRLSPVKVNNVEETAHGFGLRLDAVVEDGEVEDLAEPYCDDEPLDLVPDAEFDDGVSEASSEFEHNVDADVDVDELDVEEPNVEILQQSVMVSSPPLPTAPQLSPLCDSRTAGNRGAPPEHRRHPRPFTTIAEEKAWVATPEDAPLPPPPVARPQQSPSKRPLLSLRTVPPEEAAKVALPPSAVVATPDTSVDSIPFNKPIKEPTPKTSATSARTAKRPVPATNRKEVVRKEELKKEDIRKEEAKKEVRKKPAAEEAKPTTKPPVKPRPTRPPITRGRSETRKDEKEARPAKPTPRATSATSAASGTSAHKSASATDKTAASRATPDSTSAHSPTRSPIRVNSRLPLPRPGCNNVLPASQQSPLNMERIAAKLAASEREADAARVRAKLKAARLGKGVSLPPPTGGSVEVDDIDDDNHTSGSAAAPTTAAAGMSTRSAESDSAASGSASSVMLASTAGSAATMATTVTAASCAGRNEEEDGEGDADVDELGLSPVQAQQQQQHQQPSSPRKQAQAQLRAKPPSPRKQAQKQQQQQQQRPLPKQRSQPSQPPKPPQQQQAQKPPASGAAPDSPSKRQPAPVPPRKRERRTSKVASRRRSTLNPWELDALIQGGTVTVER